MGSHEVLGVAWFSGALSQALEILHHYWTLGRPHTVFVVGCFTAIKQRAWLGVSLLLCFLCVCIMLCILRHLKLL